MNRNYFLKSLGLVSGGLLAVRSGLAYDNPEDFAKALAGAPDDRDFWKKIREQFIFPDDYIYFNTGGIGAVPRPVLDMVEKSNIENEQYPRPGHDEVRWLNVKKTCAPFYGPTVEPEELSLVSTATEGINIILNGLMLKSGDEVITSYHEHVALNLPLLNHIKVSGIAVKAFEPDLQTAAGNVEAIRKLITPRTRLIFISHITTTTGQLFPIAEIGKLAQEMKIPFAVDGAQAVGAMPMDVKALGIDFYAASGHKWLLGPKRTGLLYISREKRELVHPMTIGAYSEMENDLRKGDFRFRDSGMRYEYGTQNEALFFGLERGAQFIQAIGIDKVHSHNRFLAEKFYQGIGRIPGMELLSPAEEEYRSAMITFRNKTKNNQEIANYLTGEKRIRVRVVPEAGLNAVRVSFHVCNQEWEVERILEEVGRIC